MFTLDFFCLFHLENSWNSDRRFYFPCFGNITFSVSKLSRSDQNILTLITILYIIYKNQTVGSVTENQDLILLVVCYSQKLDKTFFLYVADKNCVTGQTFKVDLVIIMSKNIQLTPSRKLSNTQCFSSTP